MKKIIIATTVALALSTTFAAAQSSQGQAGANTGPTSNSAVNQNNGTTSNEINREGQTNRGTSAGGMTTGAAGAGNNGNSMSGSNSLANPNNAAGSGSGSAGMK
jgi:hypothetical protein